MAEKTQLDDSIVAFRAFYEAALPRVFGYLLTRSRNRTTAEDLTQETFMAVLRAVREGQPAAMTVPWALAVARNKHIDALRAREREQRKLQLVHDSERGQDELSSWLEAATAHERERALEALLSLPETQRMAVALRYLDDLSVPEVAEALGRSIHATESLLARGRETLRRRFREVRDA